MKKISLKKYCNHLGKEIHVENENIIDISTSMSGTGPMYTYMLVESMIDAGIHGPFKRKKQKVSISNSIGFNRIYD